MRLLARELPGVLACDEERVLPGVEGIMETRRLPGVRTTSLFSSGLGCAAHPQPRAPAVMRLSESGILRRWVE